MDARYPAGLRSDLRLTSGTLAAKWAELVSQALLVLILPRALGPSGYGEFAVAFAAVALLSASLGLGAPLAAVRFVPAAAARDRLDLTRAVARAVALSRLRILGVLTAAAVVLAPVLLGIPLPLTLVVSAAAWCAVASSVASELGLALGRPGIWNLRFPVENTLVVAAAPAGYAIAGAHGAIVGMAVACVATFALLFGPLAAELRGAAPGLSLPAGATEYARLETVSVSLGTFIKRGAPLAMGLAAASAEQTGFAALAAGVGAAGAATMIDLLVVHLPRLVRIRAESRERARVEAERTARFGLFVAMATALPAALLAGPAIDLLLGSGFSGARDPVALALPAVPLGVAPGLATAVASLDLRPRPLAWSWAIGAAVFMAVAVAAIPGSGASGAAAAMPAGLLAAGLSSAMLVGGRELRRTCLAGLAGAAMVAVAGALTP